MPTVKDINERREHDRRITRNVSFDEIRTRDENNEPVIEGYFAVFNSEYKLWDGAIETIAPGAFDNTISGDIRALINHDTTLVIGRTTAGTLELKVDQRGLWGRIRVNPNDTDAMNIHARVERGDVSGCSIGFFIVSEETDYRADGSIHWTITEVELFEVSCCTFPAYEETAIKARADEYEQIKARKADAWRERMFSKIKNKEVATNGNQNVNATEED